MPKGPKLNKLSPTSVGPFRVKKRIGALTFVLVDARGKERIANVRQCVYRPFPRSDSVPIAPSHPPAVASPSVPSLQNPVEPPPLTVPLSVSANRDVQPPVSPSSASGASAPHSEPLSPSSPSPVLPAPAVIPVPRHFAIFVDIDDQRLAVGRIDRASDSEVELHAFSYYRHCLGEHQFKPAWFHPSKPRSELRLAAQAPPPPWQPFLLTAPVSSLIYVFPALERSGRLPVDALEAVHDPQRNRADLP